LECGPQICGSHFLKAIFFADAVDANVIKSCGSMKIISFRELKLMKDAGKFKDLSLN
jgi:hypothetical protein